MGKVRDTHFVFQKSTNSQNKPFGVQESCTEICGTVDLVRFRLVFPGDVRVEYFGKELRNCKILGIFYEKGLKFLMITGAPKFEVILMKKRRIARVTPLDTRANFTVHSIS